MRSTIDKVVLFYNFFFKQRHYPSYIHSYTLCYLYELLVLPVIGHMPEYTCMSSKAT